MSRFHDHGGNIFAAARMLGTDAGQIADFSASINPLGMSRGAREAIIAALDSLVHYPDQSQQALRQALASHHGVDAACIAAANGSTELIHRLPTLLKGSRALIVAPAFSEYARALEQQNWEVRYFILAAADGFSLDTGTLASELSHGIDALFLCNPGNPTGTLYPAELVAEVLEICRAAGTFLVLDEAFMDFCEESSAKQALIAGGNGIVLRSMTKFFGIPGLRLGYALAETALIGRIDARGGPWSVNTLASAAGVASLRDSAYRAATIEYVARERRLLSASLSAFPEMTVYPSAANYLLVNLADNAMDAPAVREHLAHRGVLVRDCSNFVGLSSRFFRVAVRTAEDNRRLLRGLEDILGVRRPQDCPHDPET